MDNLYDSMGRKIIVDRTNGPWTPEGGTGGAGHYGLDCNEYGIGVGFITKIPEESAEVWNKRV